MAARCLIAVLSAGFALTAAASPPMKPDAAAPPPAGTAVEVRCVDDSTLKLRLLDEKLELVTRFGTLQIPAAEVQRIEFATRLPAGMGDKIAAAVAALGSPEYRVRERAAADLKGFRAWAYPAVLKATEHADPEVVKRAEAVADYLRATVPPELLDHREQDVIHTADAKIPGRLSATAFRVYTAQFGEQQLRLSDVLSLGQSQSAAVAAAVPSPPTLMGYVNQIGKELTLRVTGVAGAPTGLWGTDVYTLDSSVAAAAVHVGAVRPGQTGVVRVRIVASPNQFLPTARHGVQSQGYGPFNGGAFQFVGK